MTTQGAWAQHKAAHKELDAALKDGQVTFVARTIAFDAWFEATKLKGHCPDEWEVLEKAEAADREARKRSDTALEEFYRAVDSYWEHKGYVLDLEAK